MDRKSWIIIALCAVVLGVNFYYSGQKNQTDVASPVTPQVVTTASSSSSQPSSSTSSLLGAGLIVQKPTPQVKKEVIASLVQGPVGDELKSIRFDFCNIGGGLDYTELEGDVVDTKHAPDKNVCLNAQTPAPIGALVFNVSSSSTSPVFDTTVYTKSPESTDKTVVLVGELNGLTIRKEFSLVPNKEKTDEVTGNDYMLSVKVSVTNASGQNTAFSDWGIFAGGNGSLTYDETEMYTNMFWKHEGDFSTKGASIFKDGFTGAGKTFFYEPLNDVRYIGSMSQFYVTMFLPQQGTVVSAVYGAPYKYQNLNDKGKAKDETGVDVIAVLPTLDLPNGVTKSLGFDVFTGPKLNQMLRTMPNDMGDVMDYGWLTIISAPMNWLLNFFHGIFGNWGWAIIGMTIVVRALIWPLHKKSYMSMKRMSQLQPKMKELREKYADDPQKLNTEMMKMYQKFGINPVGGCLPMLIQIPIFFAFYRVLQYSTEMRGEPFIFWVKDLARPDTVFDLQLPFDLPFIGADLPINILPILMGASMLLQMHLTPQAGDKMQQRIMKFMPLMFFAFCYNFASALALYWTTQNIISIGQTYLIRRLPEPKIEPKKKKPGFFQRLMEQQQMMMDQQERAKKNQTSGGMRNITPPKK